MTGTISLRALGRVLGVSVTSIRKALVAGVFSARSVHRDENGKPIVTDATLAVNEWEKSGRRFQRSRPRPTPALAEVQTSALPTRDVFEAFHDEFTVTVLRHDDCAICLSFVRGPREVVFLLRPPVHAFLLGERLNVASMDAIGDDEANA